MNIRRILVYIIGAAFVSISIFLYIHEINNYNDAKTTMMTIRAARLIHAGEIIQEDMLVRISSPILSHDADAATDEKGLIGKTVAVPIGVNEEFAKWKIGDNIIFPKNDEKLYSFKTDSLVNVNNMVRRGDRVDVWVDFDAPKTISDQSGTKMLVGSVKIIENLLVANVKTAEGIEVVDTNGAEAIINSIKNGTDALNQEGLNQIRSKPNGKPDANTYIMTDDINNAYVIGSLGGKIKLSLPNLYSKLSDDAKPAKLTDMFLQLRQTDVFNKEIKNQDVHVGKINPNQVSGSEASQAKEEPGKTSANSNDASITSSQNSTTPNVAQVK